tara:strand:- start:180 stop:320 length:141 start_codon:yes stop_codon:yes gene_type:complete
MFAWGMKVDFNLFGKLFPDDALYLLSVKTVINNNPKVMYTNARASM